MWIGTDFLLESGRVARRPLIAWAGQLRRELQPPQTCTAEHRRGVAACLNQAALIEVFRGDLPGAQALCELELDWLAALARSRAAEATALATQPWINLGRLLRMRGQHAASLTHFSLVLDARAGRAVAMGPVLGQIPQDPGLLQVLESVYVADSCKSHFAAGGFAAALDFLQRALPELRCDLALLHEARVLALWRLGRSCDALAATQHPAWLASPYRRLARVTYRLAVQLAEGPTSALRSALRALVAKVLAAPLLLEDDPRGARYLRALGSLARAGEAGDAAREVCRRGLQLARRIQDMPLELAFIEELLAGPALGDRSALEAERAALLRECLYAMILEPRGRIASATRASHPVFRALRADFERLLRTALEDGG
jgi:hypothetical protein